MNQPNSDKITQSSVPLVASMALGGQVGCITLLIVVVALIGGLWLDKQLDSKPVFTIILVVGSAPLSLFLTFWLAMRQIRDMQSNLPSAATGCKGIVPDDDKMDSET